MKKFGSLTLGLLLATVITCNTAIADTSGQLLQQGLYAEEVEGNMDSAIRIYGQVIKTSSAPPNQVAQALYRQGMCYMKLRDELAARAALEKLVAEYPNQTELVAKARPVLEELTDFDPAALMPAGTLLYIELGNPGRQIETILSLLKGTPFENPLAAMGGKPSGGSNQKSPGDIVGALLNPSMMAEFKKIRSSAIGITGLAQNNPPMVSVLYPGKSDALRGLLLAAIGMAGGHGETMEGMQTVNIELNDQQSLAIAYDERVFITAMPASQLSWCVKQYKGLSSEPTLASANKSFSKLTKAQRQKNALTLWANVDEGYAQLLKMFPSGQIPREIQTADAIVDFTNIDDVILTQSVETNGFGSGLDIQFKDGHHCLAYDLIRTPNITRAALEAVPAEAIAVASFSLSQKDGAQTEKVRAKIQNVTGLDLGREIFANVEQVTIYAMPAGENAAANKFLPNRFGLAVTSRNPEQTRQILTTLLGTASTLSGGSPNNGSGQYKIGANGNESLDCYVDQVNGITLLSLNREVVNASANAIKRHQSVCVSGPLSSAVNKLAPSASKLLLVNAGGAIRLAGPQMKFGKLDAEKESQLKDNLDQLAKAMDSTTIQLRTDERLDNFVASTAVTGIPPLNKVIGPITEIQRISNQARAEVAAKELQKAKSATLRQASQAPLIDGKMDDVWNTAGTYKLENILSSSADYSNNLSAGFKAMWDDNNLYVLVDVTDGILRHDADVRWQFNDSIELYLDCDNSKAPEFGKNDYAYSFNWDATLPEMKESHHERTEGVKYSLVTTDKGYCLEAAFPWTTLGFRPSAGAKIGLDVQVNDNRGNKQRDGKISWHDDRDRAWQTPQAFGNAELAGLIGWWKFDETDGKTAKDSSGGNHNGTLVGTAKWAKGKTGGAISLDGAGSFVKIADKAAFDMGGQITLASWVNIRSVPTGWMAIMTKGDSAWRLSTSDRLRKFHFAFNTGADSVRADAEHIVNANEWHHVAAVYDGHAMRLYVDGKLDGTQPWTGGIATTEADVLIGENVEQPNRCFDGLIDDVRIYNYALSENELKTLAAGQ